VWPEQRKTADNIYKFFSQHIEKMGARNVVAFVSDTEPTMQAVWDRLHEKYPWLLIIPCAAHCFDLLFKDTIRHPALAAAHRAHIRRQKHVCFVVFWGEQEI